MKTPPPRRRNEDEYRWYLDKDGRLQDRNNPEVKETR